MLKKPSHPGEILKLEFLEPLGLSEGALAKRLGVPRTRIGRLVKGVTSVTPDTAFRLARFFGFNATVLAEYANQPRHCECKHRCQQY